MKNRIHVKWFSSKSVINFVRRIFLFRFFFCCRCSLLGNFKWQIYFVLLRRWWWIFMCLSTRIIGSYNANNHAIGWPIHLNFARILCFFSFTAFFLYSFCRQQLEKNRKFDGRKKSEHERIKMLLVRTSTRIFVSRNKKKYFAREKGKEKEWGGSGGEFIGGCALLHRS